eukprot:g30516.t1
MGPLGKGALALFGGGLLVAALLLLQGMMGGRDIDMPRDSYYISSSSYVIQTNRDETGEIRSKVDENSGVWTNIPGLQGRSGPPPERAREQLRATEETWKKRSNSGMASETNLPRRASKVSDYAAATSCLLEGLRYRDPLDLLQFLRGVLQEVIKSEELAIEAAKESRAKRGGGFSLQAEAEADAEKTEVSGATRRWRRTVRAVFNAEARGKVLDKYDLRQAARSTLV